MINAMDESLKSSDIPTESESSETLSRNNEGSIISPAINL